MLTAFVMALVLQQAAGSGVVWATPAPEPETLATPAVAPGDLPDRALADPFGFERAQCSPMLRRDASLEICQSRVRNQLFAAPGQRLPAGLQPVGELDPCLATPGDDGAYPVQCGLPGRRRAETATPQVPDCRPRPTRQGGSVAFVTECRTENAGDGGLSFRLFGKD
jgi:hypothetical protein